MQSLAVQSLLLAVPVPLVLIGTDSRVSSMNERATALFGADGTGRHYVMVLRNPVLLEAIERAFQQGSVETTRFQATSEERDSVFRVSITPVEGEMGDGVLVAFEDITDLELAGEMRRDFVANVSHELKTPLTALLSFIETLRGAAKNDPEARDRFLGIMEREGERMNRLVSDLLSLSRVEGSERRRPTAIVRIDELVASTISALRPMSEAAGVKLTLTSHGEDTQLEAPCDPDQLVQVFSNLIENAVKYGGGGGAVDIHAVYLERELALRGPAVQIDVVDHGEGFDPIHIPRLTERFYRVDAHRSREKGGTGLGLAIAKHIVNRHRGRLRISTEPGKGSVFSVLLPASSAPTPE